MLISVRVADRPVTTMEPEKFSKFVQESTTHYLSIGDVQNNDISQPFEYEELMPQSNSAFENMIDNPAAAHPSLMPPSLEATPFSELLLSEEASPGVSEGYFDAFRPPNALTSFPFDLSAGDLQESSGHDIFQLHSSQCRPLQSQESTPTRVLERSLFEGCHAEEVVMPLQFLKRYFPVHLTYDSLCEHVRSASPPAELIDLVNRMELHLHIEDLLCQSFEESARNIRARQGVRAGHGADQSYGTESSQASIQRSVYCGNNRIRNISQKALEKKGKALVHLMWATPVGNIKLRLAAMGDLSSESNPQFVLQVSFVPRDEKRTTGISIDFEGAPDNRPAYSLGRYIKTINVVPQESDVIQCVSRNDVRSLQILFDKREASALDVDPQGFSLLSVSILSTSVRTIVLGTYY